VSTDAELETWQREWRDQTEPLPELKKKIKRQNLRTFAAVVAICVCLVFSTVSALRGHSSFMAGLATGLWFASLSMGGYAWRVRRGSWRPTAQTTLAYAELAYQRALAKARILRFAFYFLLTATILYAGFVAWEAAWHARTFSGKGLLLLVLAGMVAELFLFRHLARRQKKEIEKTGKLLEVTREDSEFRLTER
jgi:hypothetical protein